ncbi:MAG: hypothetical protein Q9187_006964 [Circinaria calcarea]
MSIAPFLRSGPNGLYITDLPAFLASPCSAPISTDPNKSTWTDPSTRAQFSQMHIPAKELELLLYNKSRDTNRICPGCMLWYDLSRPGNPSAGISATLAQEMDLSGICSQSCMDELAGPEAGKALMGKDTGRMGDQEWEVLERESREAEKGGQNRFRVRRPVDGEPGDMVAESRSGFGVAR